MSAKKKSGSMFERFRDPKSKVITTIMLRKITNRTGGVPKSFLENMDIRAIHLFSPKVPEGGSPWNGIGSLHMEVGEETKTIPFSMTPIDYYMLPTLEEFMDKHDRMKGLVDHILEDTEGQEGKDS